jgi:tRNA pseudouridine55 synthase
MLTDKGYDATVRLGVTTTTDDAEGEVVAQTPASFHQPGLVDAEFREEVGEIMQVPTAVSAIKVDGKRAYQRVRDGEHVELKPRPVTIHSLEVHDQRVVGDWLDVDISVRCSSGTYVRAIARDVGARLGVGGHLTALRRTAVGPYGLDVARTLDQLADDFTVLPIADAARAAFPGVDLDDEAAADVRVGRKLDLELAGLTAVFAPDGEFLALYEPRDGRARPVAVFV